MRVGILNYLSSQLSKCGFRKITEFCYRIIKLSVGGCTLKIFLDDKREVSKTYKYNCVSTYEECTTLIDIFKDELEYISLDYDLGEKSKFTGFDVLEYMNRLGIRPKHINIHSDHQVGVPKMREYAEKNFLETSVTTQKI